MSLQGFLQGMADVAQGVRRRAHGFRNDTRGNTTIIFALCVIPIFGSVGAAVDYSRANNARTAMQAALDATALMISKQALDLQSAQVQTKARALISTRCSTVPTSGAGTQR